jgi:hypothetical protein
MVDLISAVNYESQTKDSELMSGDAPMPASSQVARLALLTARILRHSSFEEVGTTL